MKCYIFDIDGTLADLSHRHHFITQSPKDWVAFKAECHADKPIPHMVNLCHTLYMAGRNAYDQYEIVLMSGRNEHQRDDTLQWLYEVARLPRMKLYMRADEDYRPDHIIKLELLQQVKADGYEPIMAFDDRNQVVNMWRENGIPCAQVAPGDF